MTKQTKGLLLISLILALGVGGLAGLMVTGCWVFLVIEASAIPVAFYGVVKIPV